MRVCSPSRHVCMCSSCSTYEVSTSFCVPEARPILHPQSLRRFSVHRASLILHRKVYFEEHEYDSLLYL